MMADKHHCLNRRIVTNRLFPEAVHQSAEEHLHPWRAMDSQTRTKPLLRIWDQFSGSQPTEDGCMVSRAPEMRLSNATSRRDSLAKHLNHKVWIPGPYISFTTSSTAVEDLAQMRIPKRGPQTLTVVDPNSRIANGLPILHATAEMDHYNITDPYGQSNEYYVNHYVCLWEVTEAEIVGHWDWNHLASNENWYEDVILPAFQRFATKAFGADRCVEENMYDLQDSFKKLSVKYEALCYSNSDTSDGETGYYFHDEYDWDTDDEIEEENTADDILKIIEGDW